MGRDLWVVWVGNMDGCHASKISAKIAVIRINRGSQVSPEDLCICDDTPTSWVSLMGDWMEIHGVGVSCQIICI